MTRSPRIQTASVPAPRLRGLAVLAGEGLWSAGGATPGPAGDLLPVETPQLAGERFRRATRECLLAVAAVQSALADGGLDRGELSGERTGILYVTAAGYAAANRAFLEDETSASLHFPYTAPSAVPGEVTIELGIRGPYVNLMGGGTTTLLGLWQAARWLADDVADRVLVLSVETAHEVRDLFRRVRSLCPGPVVEGAACVVLERASAGSPPTELAWASVVSPRLGADGGVPAVLEGVLRGGGPRLLASGAARRPERVEREVLAARGLAPVRLGGIPAELLACGPLVGLARRRAVDPDGPCLVTATWRSEYGAMLWP